MKTYHLVQPPGRRRARRGRGVVRRVVVAVVVAPVVIGVAGSLAHAQSAQRSAPVVQVQQDSSHGQVPAPASSAAAGKSHTVARAVAGHLAYHLVPHVPYVFRPRIFRRRY